MAGLKRIAPVTSVSEPGKAALGLIQRRVHTMTDSELLRFGLIAKFECSELPREIWNSKRIAQRHFRESPLPFGAQFFELCR